MNLKCFTLIVIFVIIFSLGNVSASEDIAFDVSSVDILIINNSPNFISGDSDNELCESPEISSFNDSSSDMYSQHNSSIEGNLSNIISNDAEPDYGNITMINGSAVDDVFPFVKLDVEKVVINNSEIKVGDTVTFLITVTNNGNYNATNVTVIDTLHDSFDYAYTSYDCQLANGNITWNVDKICAGESFEIYLGVTALAEGNFTNIATAYSNENKTKSHGIVDIMINPFVLLDVTYIIDRNPHLNEFDTVTFTYTLSNRGKSDAKNVTFIDYLDDDFDFVYSDGIYDSHNRSVCWNIDKLNAGESINVYVTAMALKNNTIINLTDENYTETSDDKNKPNHDSHYASESSHSVIIYIEKESSEDDSNNSLPDIATESKSDQNSESVSDPISQLSSISIFESDNILSIINTGEVTSTIDLLTHDISNNFESLTDSFFNIFSSDNSNSNNVRFGSENNSENSPVKSVSSSNYSKTPIIIFALFLIVLIVIIAFYKIKS